jgi:hypothetical protein
VRVSARAMGQWYPGEGTSAPGCGDDPCSLADYLWVSDQCAAWLECAGQPAVTVSNVLGQGTSSILGGAASVVGAGVSGAVSNTTTDIVIAMVLAGAIAMWILLDKL